MFKTCAISALIAATEAVNVEHCGRDHSLDLDLDHDHDHSHAHVGHDHSFGGYGHVDTVLDSYVAPAVRKPVAVVHKKVVPVKAPVYTHSYNNNRGYGGYGGYGGLGGYGGYGGLGGYGGYGTGYGGYGG